jgi:hypothetical protein
MSVRALTLTVSDLALNFGEGDPNSKKKPMVIHIIYFNIDNPFYYNIIKG